MFICTMITNATIYKDYAKTEKEIIGQTFKVIGKTRAGAHYNALQKIHDYMNNPFVENVEIIAEWTEEI